MSDSVWPHRRQPTRILRPWDSPGKNTSPVLESEKWKGSHSVVSDSCDPMDHSLPGSSVHGIFPGKSAGVGCHCLLWLPSLNLPSSPKKRSFFRISTTGFMHFHGSSFLSSCNQSCDQQDLWLVLSNSTRNADSFCVWFYQYLSLLGSYLLFLFSTQSPTDSLNSHVFWEWICWICMFILLPTNNLKLVVILVS